MAMTEDLGAIQQENKLTMRIVSELPRRTRKKKAEKESKS